MTEFTLSLFDPNTLLPHRAGIAGLAIALAEINPETVPFTWEVSETEVKLSWNCSDQEAVTSLLQQTYRLQDGYLDVPALHLDQQGKYTFSEGVIRTFLQHSQQRKLSKKERLLTFVIDEGQPELTHSFRPIEECYYTKDFKEIFTSKGEFKPSIAMKGHHVPGLVECFTHGPYQESPSGFLALLFLPLACFYYQLSRDGSGYRSAIVIPEIKNLQQWVKRRQKAYGRTYRDFRATSSGESALRFLLQEKLIEDNQYFRVDYCEVYQLGKQQWNGNQSYLKQGVYRVQVEDRVLELYNSAYQFFQPQIRQNDKGDNWWSESNILPWLCDNLITGKPWYSGFFEFFKNNKLYERKGLIKMSQYLDEHEQIFFEAVQGSFSSFLREQIIQAEKQGRQPDYPQITDKVINRLQRPSTQQDFAKTMVDFLSRHRSKATRGVGMEIYHWLHKDNNWKQARDLALLAIASYTSKTKDGETEIPLELPDESDSDNGLEMSIL
ncbi:type I-MYXAN CRISPR-associated Cas8a1/Cmx1 [Gloeocapsa sp. PCC 73106]|uniref:type I-MYXAN CRISPR-associated Cas8a1/Cmx1 n=1 Tax=Gloeocapsa sp. PCC 73106 TaxID=102232 RepID=UPI0002AD1036|nr:type I-MYXAN CRISPR-associated Cas8a1/Cmx1 [Gloeocapsa sp. PCC 73106]ELR97559.1 CRISPR-associated protein Cas8a1/Csx13, MYXAN subtype [Gloeocapsa sp. PCC 73106]